MLSLSPSRLNKLKLLTIYLIILQYALFKIIEDYYTLSIIGKKNIPKKNGYVIISNHNFLSEILDISLFTEVINLIPNSVLEKSNFTIDSLINIIVKRIEIVKF